MAKIIKVLIVDDSALVRRMLAGIFDAEPDFQVVGEAPDPYIARELIKKHNPDVLTLDVEMPKMDGLTFLSHLMRLRPMPVVMISSLTESGAAITLEALALGAVDFVAKPKLDLIHGIDNAAAEIVAKVRSAAGARVVNARRGPSPAATGTQSGSGALYSLAGHFKTTDQIIAIGASTGGTEAIRELLQTFPPDAPGIVITQHIPPVFSLSFAKRLDTHCALRVFHAEDGQRILPGHAYVAPGGLHMAVRKSGAHWTCHVYESAPVNHHKPSVDVLFRSVAQNAGGNALGVILTGMGEDGAAGLKAMREAGAYTVAQDEDSSVIWGMPGSAVRLGAVDEVLPLNRIGGKILDQAASRSSVLSSGRAQVRAI